jgi:diguanylate cyclase (GGDEF)-like protein/PAS domain S-box-containing protein
MTDDPSTSPVSDELLVRVLSLNSEGVIVTDADQVIIYANKAVQDLVGYSDTEMLGRTCRFLQGNDTDPATVRAIREALTAGKTFRGPILNYRRNGDQFWNGLTITPVRGPDGEVTHFASLQRDISELVALRDDLRTQIWREKREAETARLLLDVARLLGDHSSVSDLAESIAEGIRVVCAADRSVIEVWDAPSGQRRLGAQTGWPAHLSIEVAQFSVLDSEVPELAALVASGRPFLVGAGAAEDMQRLLDRLEVRAFAGMPITSRGEMRGVLLAYWAASTPPTAISEFLEERLQGLGTLAAVALDNAELLERAVWESTHDSLTGLPTRMLFEESLFRELAASSASPAGVSVLYLDIDDFKRTNDTLGHHAGDVVMRHIAAVLLDSTGESDVVARFGGDEFLVLLTHQDQRASAEHVAARIRKKLGVPLRLSGRDVFVSASIGIAVSSELDSAMPVGLKAQMLTAAADRAMYREKAARTGAPERSLHPRELSIDSALHGAVARGEFTAHFQPQLDHATDSITDVEALARWSHPELGDLSPTEFIPVAEKNGVIHEIGAEMLRQACALARVAFASGRPLTVSVNVPVIQLMEQTFVETVTAILSENAVPADRLTIELTESQFLADVPQIIGRLQRLRDLGIGISLDDFGAGNTSLLQLYDLPLTELKIDQAFIRKDGPVGEALIEGVVDMAHKINLAVVTEGVETAHQLDVARRLGSDRIQGYYIARPLGHDELLAWLHAYAAGAEPHTAGL